MTDNRTQLLLDMLYAFLIDYQNILKAAISEEISEKETIARQRAIVREHAERIAATLGNDKMTDNAIELLRKLLDEHGVKWTSKPTCPETTWAHNGWWYNAKFEPWSDSTFKVIIYDLTPERAIAATLGEKQRDKTEKWLLDACNRATRDYVKQLEELVRDWQVLYEHPDYGDCVRLRKRMQELGIEVIDE